MAGDKSDFFLTSRKAGEIKSQIELLIFWIEPIDKIQKRLKHVDVNARFDGQSSLPKKYCRHLGLVRQIRDFRCERQRFLVQCNFVRGRVVHIERCRD